MTGVVRAALWAGVVALAARPAPVWAGPPAQAPVRDAAGAPIVAGTGVITGTVVTDDTAAKPVRRATVSLTTGALGSPQSTVTDDAGAFVFGALPAGNYTVSASRPGYVTGYYGARRAGRGPGTPVAVVDGQHVDRVEVRLLHGAVITGMLRAPSGTPIPGAPVQVIERNADTTEQLTQIAGSTSATDDRGIYRVYGLRPGSYTVMVRAQGAQIGANQELRQVTSAELAWAEASARPSSRATPVPPPPPGPTVAFASTYYPGTADLAMAGSVTVAAGEERSGVDITLTMLPTARVTGVLSGLDGQPVPGTPIAVRAVGSSDLLAQMMLGSTGRTGPDGHFQLTNLAPGRYVISARAAPPRPGAPPTPAGPVSPQDAAMTLMAQMYGGGGGANTTLWAQQEIVVDGHDVNDVLLRLQPGMTVSGKIVFEGSPTAPAADPAHTRLMLMNLPNSLSGLNVSSMMASMAIATAAADGTFQAAGIMPNQYRLQVMAPGMMLTPQLPQSQPGWVLKSVMLNGRDVADASFEVKPGENVTGMVVTMTDRISELSGQVVDSAGRPAVGFPIVVFSTDRATWTLGSRRVQQVRPSTDGRYRVSGLPEGEYFVCAVTELLPDQLYAPGYLEQLVAGSFKITLGEGEKKVQDLKLGGGGD